MDMSVEDVCKELWFFLAKMCLKTKGVPDHKQYTFKLQQRPCCWESFPVTIPNNKDKEQQAYI